MLIGLLQHRDQVVHLGPGRFSVDPRQLILPLAVEVTSKIPEPRSLTIAADERRYVLDGKRLLEGMPFGILPCVPVDAPRPDPTCRYTGKNCDEACRSEHSFAQEPLR